MVPVRIWGILSGETRATFKAERIHPYKSGGNRGWTTGNLDESDQPEPGQDRSKIDARLFFWFTIWPVRCPSFSFPIDQDDREDRVQN